MMNFFFLSNTKAVFSLVSYFCTAIFFVFNLLFINSAIAADLQCPHQIRGINLAGPEFSEQSLPGTAGVDYYFPSASHLSYYSQHGFNATRLPLTWERLQPKLFDKLDDNYSNLLLEYMHQANRAGQVVLVDIHNYGRYRGELIGSSKVPSAAFKDLWKRLALLLKDQPALYAYGLMNEPHNTNDSWHSVAQFGVDGIRMVDSEHKIYVAGDNWSSAAAWPNSNPKPFVTDISNKIVYEAHVYFDDNFSGRYEKPIGNINLKERVENRVLPFINWLDKYNVQGVIGEWGVPTSDLSYELAVISFIELTNVKCIDWFVWAGGSWSTGYNLSLEPAGRQDKPILKVISNKLIMKH
jgi:endoglucanase